MRLDSLLGAVDAREVRGGLEIDVDAVVADSRLVRPGSLFVAVPGFQFDGADFIDKALGKGAVGIVTERRGLTLDVPVVEVDSARNALALLSAEIYGRPAGKLALIGVTGTSGKTTTTKMIESILDQSGDPVGLIGTIEYRAGDRREIADRTTPDATVLQEWFAAMVETGVRHAVMEVSSHALALGRTHGVPFSVAVFTNLSRDHFDFHLNFDDYFATKKMLFDQIDRTKQCGVVNLDDDHGALLARELGEAALTFGFGDACDIRPAPDFAITLEGLRGSLLTPIGDVSVESALIGKPNLYNWMGAAGAAIAAGIGVDEIEGGIRALRTVKGRFERVVTPSGPAVLVDYAHKPDALEKLLHAVREVAPGRRLTVVFGCGGDRDRGKRPEMGEIAGRLADFTYLTSDNPRNEAPESILREIEAGIEAVEGAKYEIVPERREAIGRALSSGSGDEVVVVAGKGHENYQVVGDRVIHFDDREEIEAYWTKRGGN